MPTVPAPVDSAGTAGVGSSPGGNHMLPNSADIECVNNKQRLANISPASANLNLSLLGQSQSIGHDQLHEQSLNSMSAREQQHQQQALELQMSQLTAVKQAAAVNAALHQSSF